MNIDMDAIHCQTAIMKAIDTGDKELIGNALIKTADYFEIAIEDQETLDRWVSNIISTRKHRRRKRWKKLFRR